MTCAASGAFPGLHKPEDFRFVASRHWKSSRLARAGIRRKLAAVFCAPRLATQAAAKVNPYALELLEKCRLSTEGRRSKAWDEFAKPDAPKMDIIITVCNQAAGETCPVLPGQPVTAHWGVEDPVGVSGDDGAKRLAFHDAFAMLQRRINLLVSLNHRALDHLVLEQALQVISKTQ